MPQELITCTLCPKPAHGIYRKNSGEKVTSCEKCAPLWKNVSGFEPVNMHLKKKKGNIPYCQDCLSEFPESFMVTEYTWKEAGFKKFKEGTICVTCLEKRINRKLRITDFVKAPINDLIFFGYNMGIWE